MTPLVVLLSAYLSLKVARSLVAAAVEVGYPEAAGTPGGRLRMAALSGGSTYAALVGAWMLVAP